MTDSVLKTAGGIAIASAGALAYAVRVPSCSWLAPSVCRGIDTRPAIALTFDDGPSESTPALLEILARYGAPATFFEIRRQCPPVAQCGPRSCRRRTRHRQPYPIASSARAPILRFYPWGTGRRPRSHRTCHRTPSPLFPCAVRCALVRPPRRSAAPGPQRRHVEHHCARLETADARGCLPPAHWRDPGSDFVLARWPSS